MDWPITAHSFVTNQKASYQIGQKDFTLGSPNQGGLLPSKASLDTPVSITFDPKGNLWVADTRNNRILEFPILPSKTPSLKSFISNTADKVIGQTKFELGSANTGGVSSSSLAAPFDLAFDPKGNLWVADSGNSRILEYTPPFKNGQAASIVIGQADFKSKTPNAGHLATSDSLYTPIGIAFDPETGNLWVADYYNSRVLRIYFSI